jgi:creatinine amidohydrolase
VNRIIKIIVILIFAFVIMNALAFAQEVNPLFKETKVKNYLPHMTWKEVEEALKRTDMVIIPVGSIEQHGHHLPLCTDIYAAIEQCKLIAQEADVLVAPPLLVGLSEHHMGFPGTLTLSPETFEAVLYETAQSLIRHGFKKILFYNGHGGNTTSVNNVVQKINQTTPAIAFFLNTLQLPQEKEPENYPDYDWHAGVGETSLMLYLTNSLVDMSQAVKPELTFPPYVQSAEKKLDASPQKENLQAMLMSDFFRPKDTGKKSSTREMTNTGAFTTGNPKDGTAEMGKKEADRFVKAAVQFIKEWKKLEQ